MKALRILAVLLLIPITCFAGYKVVVKKTGKVIEGKYLSEDDRNLSLMTDDGIKISFKKDLLDLDKMKELNADAQTQAVAPPPPPPPKKTETSGDSNLVALSKKLKAEHAGKEHHMANVKPGSGSSLDTASGDQQQDEQQSEQTQTQSAAAKEFAKDEATIQKGIADCQRWLATYQQSIADYKQQGKDTTKLEEMMKRTQEQLDKLEADLDALHSGAAQQSSDQ